MTVPAPIDQATFQRSAPASRGVVLLRRILRDPVAVASLVVLLIIIVACAIAPLLTSLDPARAILAETLTPPGPGHPLGGDSVGRDVFARLLYGGRLTLIGGAIAVLVALAIGVPTGLLAGFYRGKLDAFLSWVTSLIMAVPAIIILLVVMAVVSQSIYFAMSVLGIILAPGIFWLVRSCVLAVREELYIDAARVAGLTNSRILTNHILPVVLGPVLIQAVGTFGVAVGIQAGLAFLGLGSASEASWGAMLNDAFPNIYTNPSLLIWPGVAIGLTVASLNLLANSLRDLLGGDQKGGRRTKTAQPEPITHPNSTPSNALLLVSNLTVSYTNGVEESRVVKSVSLSINKGEVLGLVGESGSGKSQTAFSILGLLPDQASCAASTLSFDSTPLLALNSSSMNAIRGRRIGYIPQEPMSNLDPSFKIGSQLVEPIIQHLKLSGADAKTKVLALLARVGIPYPERVFNLYPHEVSGGMAQRVLIAGAVSCDPELLIADEPTTALDVTIQAEILDLLRSLQKERNMGVLLVTHDFGVVADICDRVAVMKQGEIVEASDTASLFANPQSEYTKVLLGSTLEGKPARRPLDSFASTRNLSDRGNQ